jgi:hypothetical protein
MGVRDVPPPLTPLSDMNIKEFYLNTYSTDELGVEINETATFIGLYHALITGNDPYEYIGVSDSVVRERCFEKLAEIIGTSYDYVYDLWLYDNPITLGPAIEFTVVEE